MNASIRRLLSALAIFALLITFGSAGYYALGRGRWDLEECVYMTFITVSTVGSMELSQMRQVPGARFLTVVIILSGVGTITYIQSNLTAILVEGVIGHVLRRNRMRKQIAALSGHMVVAGAGSTGKHVIEEFAATKTPFVVIDRNADLLERLSLDLMGGRMLFVHGDAVEDHVLLAAGVDRAHGVVAALTADKDNLYVTLSARSLNPKAKIVSKVVEDEAGAKVLKAGATAVVNPTAIGGRRMASEIIRPEVNEFLDQMLRDRDRKLRLEEVSITKRSPFLGKTLREIDIKREMRLLVVAVRGLDRIFIYNPEPDYVFKEGTTLIVMGELDNVQELRKMVDGAHGD